MRIRPTLLIALLLVVASLAWAHDLFLKLDTYFLEPNARVRIPVLNGTFSTSENFVTPDRVGDISVVSPQGRARLAPARVWSPGPDSTSVLSLETGAAGTYVAGASILPRELGLAGDTFNMYLAEEGITDVLEARRRANDNTRARERYSKHVKALFQVGEQRTGEFDVVLDYPAEIVPLENPYALRPGAALRVRCLVNGAPMANQTVLWGAEQAGRILRQRSTRTGPDGVAAVTLDAPGRWYVKFVHMVRASEPLLDYESNWATLTIELR